jgi:mono/diheme cytochrome c family protein
MAMRVAAVFLITIALVPGRSRAGEPVDYARDVKPILARHCVSCHGADRPKSGLRLDTAASAIRGGKGGPAVVPGRARESPLYLAVIGEGTASACP